MSILGRLEDNDYVKAYPPEDAFFTRLLYWRIQSFPRDTIHVYDSLLSVTKRPVYYKEEITSIKMTFERGKTCFKK